MIDGKLYRHDFPALYPNLVGCLIVSIGLFFMGLGIYPLLRHLRKGKEDKKQRMEELWSSANPDDDNSYH